MRTRGSPARGSPDAPHQPYGRRHEDAQVVDTTRLWPAVAPDARGAAATAAEEHDRYLECHVDRERRTSRGLRRHVVGGRGEAASRRLDRREDDLAGVAVLRDERPADDRQVRWQRADAAGEVSGQDAERRLRRTDDRHEQGRGRQVRRRHSQVVYAIQIDAWCPLTVHAEPSRLEGRGAATAGVKRQKNETTRPAGSGSPLQDAVPPEDVGELLAALQGGARLVLAAHLSERRGDDLVLHRPRYHHDAVGVTEHEVPRRHAYAGNLDRDVDRHHLAAALRVERPDAAGEHRELHLPDGADVAREAVHHGTRGTARPCSGGEQLAPGRDAPGSAAGEHRHLARLEVVDQLDLELVRVLAGRRVVNVHAERGARAAAQRQRVVERPDACLHRLVAVTGGVQAIRQNGGKERPPRIVEGRGHSGVTRACRTAACPPRTAARQRSIAAGTASGSSTSSPCAPAASASFAKFISGASSASYWFVAFASPSGYTRSVASFTAAQPELSTTTVKIGSRYCFATA